MSKEKKTLGRELATLYDQLNELEETTKDPARLEEINEQQDALFDQIAGLVEATLDQNDQKYKDATASMAAASAAVAKAIAGLESIVSAIKMVATAVDAVSKLLG